MKALIKWKKSIRDIERVTKLKKPTLTLSLNKMKKEGLTKPLGIRRSGKWALTKKGRAVVVMRIATV